MNDKDDQTGPGDPPALARIEASMGRRFLEIVYAHLPALKSLEPDHRPNNSLDPVLASGRDGHGTLELAARDNTADSTWTTADTDEAERLDSKATKGPWMQSEKDLAKGTISAIVYGDGHRVFQVGHGNHYHGEGRAREQANARWIAYTRTALPRAVAKIKDLQAKDAELLAELLDAKALIGTLETSRDRLIDQLLEANTMIVHGRR